MNAKLYLSCHFLKWFKIVKSLPLENSFETPSCCITLRSVSHILGSVAEVHSLKHSFLKSHLCVGTGWCFAINLLYRMCPSAAVTEGNDM